MSDEDMKPGKVYMDVNGERWRAHMKFQGSAAGSRENAPWDDPKWLPVLLEEVGEVAKELNEAALDPYGDYRDSMRAELVQAGLVDVAIEHVERIDPTKTL